MITNFLSTSSCAVLVLLFYSITNTVASTFPFTLGIRDSFMIAHSFHNDANFGPAGGMHGATFTCDVEFSTNNLVPTLNWVLDIGQASTLLKKVLSKYNLKNLDELFVGGEYTTSEFMAQQVFQDLATLLKEEGVKFQGELCVRLYESPTAWACYRGLV